MSETPKSPDKDAGSGFDCAKDNLIENERGELLPDDCISKSNNALVDNGGDHIDTGTPGSGKKILTQAGRGAKKTSAIAKRDYVLTHLGIETTEEMAKALGCSEDWIYKILTKIRSERELLHGRLIENVAEEQFNRLNKMADTAFKQLTAYREEHPDGGEHLYKMHKIYRDSEHGLTYFLKAVGLYRDDKPVVATQINLNIGKRGINEILAEIQQEYSADIIDVIAKKVKEDPRDEKSAEEASV